MNELYFVVMGDDDGDVSFHCYTKEQLEEKINDEIEYITGLPHYYAEQHLIPYDLQMLGNSGFIIKGELVVPKPVIKITRLEVG